ncbi:MAG TPA: hypothetical protein DEG92_06585, partial [Rikenellaceae bacterium]|nr:hypothetical protein [Rikenellaceae bacterium]
MKLKYFLLFPLLSFCANAGSSNDVYASNDIHEVQQMVKIPAIPNSMSFAGEDVPLKYFDVKEAIQRELTVISYWHASMSQIIQLNNRYG